MNTAAVDPYLSLTMIAGDGRGEELRRCLRSVLRRSDGAPMVDEVVLVDAGSGESGRAATEECAAAGVPLWVGHYREGVERPVGHFSFAEARNIALDAAAGEWAMFLDSDDVVPGGIADVRAEVAKHDAGIAAAIAAGGSTESLRGILRALPADIAAIRSPYHYARDAAGRVTTCIYRGDRVVRIGGVFRGRWRWANPIHENLFLDCEEDRGWMVRHSIPPLITLEGLVVVHEQAEGNAEVSRKRNLALLRAEVDRLGHSAPPMALYYMAEHHRFLGDEPGALALLDRVVSDVPLRSVDLVLVGYLARLSRIDALTLSGDDRAALAAALEAQSYAPAYRDAYYLAATILSGSGDHDRAAHFAAMCAGRESLLLRTGGGKSEADYLTDIACIFHRAGRRDAANAIAAEARERSPSNLPTALVRVIADLKVERVRDAYFDLLGALRDHTEMVKAQRLLECAPHFAEADPRLALARLELGVQAGHLASREKFAAAYAGEERWQPYALDHLRREVAGEVDHSMHRFRWVRDRLAELKPKRYLEIGCADGYGTIWLASRFPDAEFVGLDVDPKVVACANQRAAELGVKNASFFVADCVFCDPPPSLGRFDAVALLEILEHVPDPVDTIRRARGMLARGGALLASTPLGNYDRGVLDIRRDQACYHVRSYSIDALLRDHAAAGLRVEKLEGGGGEDAVGAGGFFTGNWHALSHEAAPGRRRSVAIIALSAPLPWGPRTGDRDGIGGSEEAVYHVSLRLAERGWDVAVYTNLEAEEEVSDGVRWLRLDRVGEGGAALEADVGIFWRCPNIDLPNARFKKRVAWLHDTCYPAKPGQWAQFNHILGVSETHEGLIRQQVGRSLWGRVGHVQNGIDASHFAGKVDRVRGRFVWTSSPDRGLETLLSMWPRIRALAPDATLRILYGWDVAEKLRALGHDAARPSERARVARLADQPGIEWVGRVPWRRAAAEMLAAEFFAYPSRFFEVSCISMMKAMAAGCRILASDCGSAVQETVPEQYRFTADFKDGTREEQDERFLALVERLLGRDREMYALADYSDQRAYALETYDWDRAVDRWEALFADLLGGAHPEPAPALALAEAKA